VVYHATSIKQNSINLFYLFPDRPLVELEKLCSLQCSNEELAAFFNVSIRTIENRRKQPKFAEAMARGKSKGKISARRSQMRLLEGGNATMGIWLGKQLLGQRDVQNVEASGPGGSPINIIISKDDERL